MSRLNSNLEDDGAPVSYLPASRSKDAYALALIVGIGLIVFSKLLFRPNDFYWGDIELYFAPMQSFLNKTLVTGIIPLWNPHIFCGEPFMGNPQTFIAYPFAALIRPFFTSPWRFVTVDAVLHVILGGLLFYPFARIERLGRKASLLASVCFMLGGYFVTKLQFPNMAQAIAYVPAILWAVALLVKSPGLKSAAWLGVALGMQVLANHAQITLLTIYLATGYMFYRRGLDRFKFPWFKIIGWGAAGSILGSLLSCVQLLPILDNLRNVDHHTLSIAIADRFDLSFGETLNCVLPNRLGNPFNGDYRGSGNYWESCFYLGWIIAIFGCLGISRAVSRDPGLPFAQRSARFWTFVSIIAVWLSFGMAGGLYIDAYYVLPGLKSFHDPARFLLIFAVGAPILAALGYEWAALKIRDNSRPFFSALVLLAVSVQLGYFDQTVYPTKPDTELQNAVIAASNAATAPGTRIIVDPDVKNIWHYFISYRDFKASDPTYLSDLFSTHIANTDMLLGIDDAGGYEPEPPIGAVNRFVAGFTRLVDHGHLRGVDKNTDMLNTLSVGNVYWYQLTGPHSGHSDGMKQLTWQNPDRLILSRAFVYETGASLSLTDTDPNSINVSVPSHAVPITVVVADTFLPGWTASVNSVAEKIYSTPDGLRRVLLPPCNHASSLLMRYEPSACFIGLYISLASLAFVLGFSIHAVLSKSN